MGEGGFDFLTLTNHETPPSLWLIPFPLMSQCQTRISRLGRVGGFKGLDPGNFRNTISAIIHVFPLPRHGQLKKQPKIKLSKSNQKNISIDHLESWTINCLINTCVRPISSFASNAVKTKWCRWGSPEPTGNPGNVCSVALHLNLPIARSLCSVSRL